MHQSFRDPTDIQALPLHGKRNLFGRKLEAGLDGASHFPDKL